MVMSASPVKGPADLEAEWLADRAREPCRHRGRAEADGRGDQDEEQERDAVEERDAGGSTGVERRRYVGVDGGRKHHPRPESFKTLPKIYPRCASTASRSEPIRTLPNPNFPLIHSAQTLPHCLIGTSAKEVGGGVDMAKTTSGGTAEYLDDTDGNDSSAGKPSPLPPPVSSKARMGDPPPKVKLNLRPPKPPPPPPPEAPTPAPAPK